MSDNDRPVMTPGSIPDIVVDTSISAPALPRVENFLNRKFDRGLVEAARNAVRVLREHAERLRQFTIIDNHGFEDSYFRGRMVTKAYWGESGEALAEAHKIQQTVNHYVDQYIFGDVERARLRIV